MLGHAEFAAGMPASPVEDQHDLFGGPSADLAGELGQFHLKEGEVDRRGQVENRTPRGRVNEADEIAPGIAVLHWSHGTLTNWRPDPPQNRLEADAMLVDGPEFDGGAGEGGCYLPQERSELFLKASCSAALACTCRGRGTWGL